MNPAPVGELAVRIIAGGVVEITRADPVIECSGGHLRTLIGADGTPLGGEGVDAGALFVDLVTFVAANRTVVYRIGSYDFERDVYRLHWPD